MLKFNPRYFLPALVLLITEILIALFINDNFIRPYLGDVLVVMLVYCSVKAFFDLPVPATAIGVFVFACFIEWLQYLQVVKLLGLEKASVARTVLGTSFEWLDIAAYAIGILVILIFEYRMIIFRNSRTTEIK
ncbi:MAG: DUF2809 domain-containing protein [Chitinophagaceae bacterium]|nr:DUF2809 domain-containing protein [Chitinophagaceae bacterium]